MQIPKPSDADKDRFRAVVPEHPDVVVKPMFGNLGAFVNGNMFAGLFGPMIGVKLSDADRHEHSRPATKRFRSARKVAPWVATSACPKAGPATKSKRRNG